jgi:SAM-dependent methyltransferase
MNPTERFSTRVENYVKYRPHYPSDILSLLEKDCGLTRASAIADIGSGTGISSELFLKHGCGVFGIEPNREMREAGIRLLRNFPKFKSLDGTAESTGLENQSVDFVIAGQAFHWFNREKAREEFKRILTPNGWVVLIWNDRRTDSTPFLQSYEKLLLKHGTDYQAVNHKQIDEKILEPFFAPKRFRKAVFENEQRFDFDGLKGRLLSSSYVPDSGERFDAMLETLRNIYDFHQSGNEVVFEYDTTVFFGQLGK